MSGQPVPPYSLFVSHNCGMNYHKERDAQSVADLLDRCRELDDEILRWYIQDGNGQMCHDLPCALHANIFGFMKAVQS